NKRSRQKQRLSAPHGQVIHRAVHGEAADVASREKDWTNHEGIGGKGHARPFHAVIFSVQADRGLVLQGRQDVVAEAGDEQPANEVGGQLAAAAVPQQDVVVARGGQRAGPERRGGFFILEI